MSTERLIEAYAEMADHTRPTCMGETEKPCKLPMTCCDRSVCLLTIEQAKWDWDVTLPTTDHPDYPLMGPQGCTAPPHTRPMCTLHNCWIASFGFKPGDPAWTERYFELRKEISDLELQKRSGAGAAG